MIKKCLFFSCMIFILAISIPAIGDENAIEEFSGINVSLTPFLTRESFQLTIKTGDEKLGYSPNVQWRYGAGMSVHNIALYFITDIPGDNMMQDEETHGKSTSLDVLIHYYGRNYGADFAFQKCEGFYLDRHDPAGGPDNRYLFPDMKSIALGINLYYLISGDRYSMRAAFDQGERQIRSGGSFVLMASLHYFRLDNSGSIIPSQFSAAAGDVAGFEGGKFVTATVGPGYGYTLAFSNFFISPAFFFGTGGQYRDYTIASGDETNARLPLKINWRIALGYNGDNVIAGLRFLVDYTMVPLGDATLQVYTLEATVFAGIRL